MSQDGESRRVGPGRAARAEIQRMLAAGVGRHQAGDLRQAEAMYREVLRHDPDNADALHLLGRVALAAGNLPVAVGLTGRAVELKPRSAAYQCSYAAALRAEGRRDDAIERYRRAIRLESANAEAHNNLGALLEEAGQLDEGLRHLTRALALKPGSAEIHNNLGISLQRSGRLDEAGEHYRRAMALKPDYADAHFNLGNWLKERGDLEAAIGSYEAALALRPGSTEGHKNLGLARLLLGDYARGWEGYEYRLGDPHGSAGRDPQRRWKGEALEGRTILVHAEQGFGDTIQFARFAAVLAARGARVLLEVQDELVRTLAQTPGVERVVARGEGTTAYDFHCPLASLPRLLAVRVESIPADIPYIHAHRELIESWGARLEPAARPRVGLVWAGNPRQENDRNRSLPFPELQPLLDVPGLSFCSLQKGPPGAQSAASSDTRIVALGDELRDFADTAAVLAQLDLLITVDTSVAHLAGALGRKAWVLLTLVPDWRWLTERQDSPWYPTLRLFRQSRRGDWRELIERVRIELAEFATRRA